MEKPATNPHGVPLLRNFKDSVFTDLFSRKEYTLQLYQALHPEDLTANEDDIEIVTVQNVLTADQHNDLGFTVGNRLLVLVEAQSTWSPNIVLRSLLYTAETMKRLVRDRGLDIYGSKPIPLPMPELYVVYTGNKKNVPNQLAFSEEFCNGAFPGIEVRVRVLHEPGTSIAGQYIEFAKTLDAYRSAYGPGEETLRQALAACVERGVLVEYLEKHREEVVGIMITLYDEEEVMRNYIRAQVREAEAKAIVSTYKELGASAADATAKLIEKLDMAEADAKALVESLW